MKYSDLKIQRFIASAGAIAVGMAAVRGQNVTGLTPQQASKWWTVSASLRGFYDDNYAFQPDGRNRKGSQGVEISPTLSMNLPLEQTLIKGDYTYRLNYFGDRPDSAIDQYHDFFARVNHKFTPIQTVNIEENFTFSNEPQLGGNNAAQATFRRDSDWFRNRFGMAYNMRLNPRFGFELGYDVTTYDYVEDRGVSRDYFIGIPASAVAFQVDSLSALLDRTEHLIRVEPQYYFQEHTFGFIGYQFGFQDYTSTDFVNALVPSPFAGPARIELPQRGSIRDTVTHYGYVGVQHDFSRQLNGAARVGMVYADHFNLEETSLSPYADLSVGYTYLPGSSARLGLKHDRSATDNSGAADQIATTTYLSVNHRITPRITASTLLTYQLSELSGGTLDGAGFSYLTLSLALDYKITENLFANLAYQYDAVSGDRGVYQDVTRNRVWMGARIVY